MTRSKSKPRPKRKPKPRIYVQPAVEAPLKVKREPAMTTPKPFTRDLYGSGNRVSFPKLDRDGDLVLSKRDLVLWESPLTGPLFKKAVISIAEEHAVAWQDDVNVVGGKPAIRYYRAEYKAPKKSASDRRMGVLWKKAQAAAELWSREMDKVSGEIALAAIERASELKLPLSTYMTRLIENDITTDLYGASGPPMVDVKIDPVARVKKQRAGLVMHLEPDHEFDAACKKLGLKPGDGPVGRELAIGLASVMDTGESAIKQVPHPATEERIPIHLQPTDTRCCGDLSAPVMVSAPNDSGVTCPKCLANMVPVHLLGSDPRFCGPNSLGLRVTDKDDEVTCAACLGIMAVSKSEAP